MSPVLLDLPGEVLVHIFAALDTTDRLILARTSTALKHAYDESPLLQYEFQLHTSAYLDVPNQPPPQISPPPDGEEAVEEEEDAESNSFINPHTGKVRPSLPSVHLAPFPEERYTRPKTTYLSPAEKLQLLKKREDNWDTLSPAKIRKFSVQGQNGVYELQEGIFLICDNYVELRDSVLVRSRPYSVRLVPLPSSTDPDLEEPILPTKVETVKFPLSDLTMDPTQDLIVVSEHIDSTGALLQRVAGVAPQTVPTHRYHLLSMSTFEPHPLAAQPVLDFPPTSQHILQTRQLLQIMGDTLVILVSRFAAHWLLAGFGGVNTGNDEEIVCWNWKTGKVLAVMIQRMALPDNGWFSSLALLTPTTFMITSTSNVSPVMPAEPISVASAFPPVIRIYSFAPDPERDISPLQPLDLEHNDDTTPRPVLVAQLHIPPAATGSTMGQFEVRPDPAFPPLPRGDQPTLGPRKPFTQDPLKGVLVFDLTIGDPPRPNANPNQQPHQNHYELFILREYIVDLATRGEERLRRSRLPGDSPDRLEIWDVAQTLPWAEWGAKHSRLLSQSMDERRWVCSCSGYRYASLAVPYRFTVEWDAAGEPSRPHDVLIYDFSPYSTRRQRQRQASTQVDSDLKAAEAGGEEEVVDVAEAEGDADADWEDDDSFASSGTWGDDLSAVQPEPLEIDVIDDQSCIERARCWEDDIWTGLPFVRIRREMGIVSNGIMIDDQRVMMVMSHEANAGQDVTVLCM